MSTTIFRAGFSAFAAIGGAVLAFQGAACAQDGDEVIELKTISVSANRTPTEKDKVGSKVEQVTEAEIEAKSRPVISDYLNLLPGVSIANNGGLGTQSGLYIRGLGSKYVKTLYNGIDISDPANTQVRTHYEYLLTGGISNIEVLKGSQSTLYGSSAITGLIDISTLGDVENGIHHTVEAEGGSFGIARGRYGFSAANDGSRFTANVSGLHSDGISAADGFPEKDGYDNVTLDFAAEHRISEAFSVFGSALHIDAKSDFDGSDSNPPYNPVDDLENKNYFKTSAGRFGVNLDLMDGRLQNTLSVQGFKMDRDVLASYGNSEFVAKRGKFDYQGSFEATDRIVLQYGLDYERQRAEIDEGVSFTKSSDLTGIWAQGIVEPMDDLTLTAGLRHDEHSEFGGHTTYRGTASYLFSNTGTRLHSSFGTGFRAPSLYELYAPFYGNSALEPETSVSFDVGLEQSFLAAQLTADLTYFRLEVDDLIDYDFVTSTYNQVPGITRSQGVEASFLYAATDWLDLGGSYTYTDSRKEDRTRNVRVPRHAVVLSAEARPAENWAVGADLKIVADTMDVGEKLDNYVLLNAKVAYQLTDSTQVYLRGENLLNENYQTVKGYGTPGISAFAGIKAEF
jgi:vitamin B12 transporter